MHTGSSPPAPTPPRLTTGQRHVLRRAAVGPLDPIILSVWGGDKRHIRALLAAGLLVAVQAADGERWWITPAGRERLRLADAHARG